MADAMWGWLPPEAPAATLECVMEAGSLTERLIATGGGFGVELLHLGPGFAHPDEAPPLGIRPGALVTARHVALSLGGAAVVVARSFCRRDCATWNPILDRGSRSLGFTLFSGETAIGRGALEYALPSAGHPLFELARAHAGGSPSLPARRCRFALGDAPLVVCEIFLPSLEAALAAARRSAQARRVNPA